MKKLSLFIAAYFVITMSWAYPWHVIWFHDLYVEWNAFQREEPIMVLGIAAVLIQGIVIGYLYPFFLKGEQSTIKKGVLFNLLIGLMVYTVMGFATAAKFAIDPILPFLIYHTVFQVAQFTLTGTALGLIYRNRTQHSRMSV